MYTPRSVRVDDTRVLRDLVSRYSVGTLISCGERGPQVTHVPFEWVEGEGGRDAVMCHVARANPHWRDFEGGGTALVGFLGPHTYVSPTWYDEPVAVPTWNYAAVHVRGKARLVHDTDLLRAHVIRLSRQYESSLEPHWDAEAMAPEFENHLKAIVGSDEAGGRGDHAAQSGRMTPFGSILGGRSECVATNAIHCSTT